MVNIPIANAQVSNDYNTNFPIAAGTYRAEITKAEFDVGTSKTQGKNFGMNRTGLKVEFEVYGAKEDGGNRKYTDWILIDHQSTDTNLRNMINANLNKVSDLTLQVVAKSFQNNASSSPFAQGLNGNTVGYLVGNLVNITLIVNKKKENEVTSYFPPEMAQETQQYSAPQQTQQAPQQVQQQIVGNVQANQLTQGYQVPQQNQQSAPSTPVAVVQQTAASHSNVQQLPHQQSGMPSFAIPQGQ
jgi:hypothetical protein